VIYLDPPADEHGAERAAGIVGGLADGAEKALGAMLDFAADFIAPPPPTKEQAERMQRATEEQRERNAAAAPEQEKDARLQELLTRSGATITGHATTATPVATSTTTITTEGASASGIEVTDDRRQSGGGEQTKPHPVSLWRRAWEVIARRLVPAAAEPPRRHSNRDLPGLMCYSGGIKRSVRPG
jgi:hypothetical protein